MTDPMDLFLLKNLITSINCKIEPIICSERSILLAIENNYSKKTEDYSDFHFDNVEKISFDWRDELNDEKPDDFQAQRIIQAILYQAVTEDMQEIVLETSSEGLEIKFKKHKECFKKGFIPILLVPLCVSKLKQMSGLDLTVSDLPQLGKLKFYADPLNIVSIVSTFPTTKGERIVIKLFKPPEKIENVSIVNDDIDSLKSILIKSGLVLVCGPDLSGKTSLIYSLLLSLDSNKYNIMTVESIAKYDLDGINQCELNEKAGFNIDKALKYIDFQSPDIVYFEEILAKEDFKKIMLLTQNNKTVITEFTADDVQALVEKINNMELNELKSMISCIIFVNKKNNIKIVSQEI